MDQPDRRRSHDLAGGSCPVFVAGLAASIVLGSSLPPVAVGQPRGRDDRDKVVESLRAATTASLDRLAETGEFAEAGVELGASFDAVIAYAPETATEAFIETALALRMADQLGRFTEGRSIDALRLLRANPALAAELAFQFTDADDPERVYTLLDRLNQRRPADVARFPGLVAALCVVHDRPMNHPELGTVVGRPDELLDHYADHADDMVFDLGTLPAGLAVYLVETTVSKRELEWALDRYEGEVLVGKHYHDVPYDMDHFKNGSPKRILSHGYTLPNLLQFGGVCGDQAYFARCAAQAIGVPATVVTGRGGSVGHAWVGFLVEEGKSTHWDFSEGRYDGYDDVRGNIRNPQTGAALADADLALLAEFARRPAETRYAAMALADAGKRWAVRAGTAQPPAIPAPAGADAAKARPATRDEALELLEASVRANPACRDAWQAAWDQSATMTPAQRKRWADAVFELCGDKYPDYTWEAMSRLVSPMTDPAEQVRLLDWAVGKYRSRPDLASRARLLAGDILAKSGDPGKAWAAYQDVIGRYINSTAVALEGVVGCEQLLVAEGKPERVVPLYESTWKKIRRPDAMAAQFLSGTNWYRVGRALADKLDQAGRARDAASVRAQLAAVSPPKRN